MEKLVTISLSEYEKLVKQNKSLTRAFEEKSIVIHHSSYFSGHSGYSHNDYKIMGETELIKNLSNQIAELHSELCKAAKELYDFKYNEPKKNKKWF